MIREKKYYLDTFGVREEDLLMLAAEGLACGGDFTDLFFESTVYSSLQLRDGEVSSGSRSIDYGVGIRVLKGEKTGYSYSESTDLKAMKDAARAAAKIAEGNGGRVEITIRSADRLLRDARDRAASYVIAGNNGDRKVRKFFPGTPNPAADRYPMIQDWRETDTAILASVLMSLKDKISARDASIVKILAMVSCQVSDILMYNSFGELKYETRPLGNITATVIFSRGGKTENKTVSRSFRCGAEMLTGALLDELAVKATSGIDERFDATRPKGGKMPVVMGAGASGILLHEAMGHAFEADFNRKGQSIFSGKIGQKVCDSRISIVDDATVKGNRGALNFDDEGVPGQRTYMVENGILTSYLHDRISAKWYGVSPTGNGRRESFRYNPIPRMRATYMESGDSSREEIISSVKKGIYVDEFTNGQVLIGEGDFTFYVKSGFLIENGRLTSPVKDINIIGNGPRALADIVAVGADATIDNGTWTCGKGQSAPVSCGIPTVLVRELTVGGD